MSCRIQRGCRVTSEQDTPLARESRSKRGTKKMAFLGILCLHLTHIHRGRTGSRSSAPWSILKQGTTCGAAPVGPAARHGYPRQTAPCAAKRCSSSLIEPLEPVMGVGVRSLKLVLITIQRKKSHFNVFNQQASNEAC